MMPKNLLNVAASPQQSVPPAPGLPEDWVEEHYEYLFRYAFRYFQNEDTAEDIVQEALVAAVASATKFKGTSSVRTWLTGILRHKIIDLVRARSSKVEQLASTPTSDTLDRYFDAAEHWTAENGPLSWTRNPEALLQERQFLKTLEDCMRKFPQKLRQLFLMRELEGFPIEEICGQFGLTSGNVRVSLHRMRISLQNCLQMNWFHRTPNK